MRPRILVALIGGATATVLAVGVAVIGVHPDPVTASEGRAQSAAQRAEAARKETARAVHDKILSGPLGSAGAGGSAGSTGTSGSAGSSTAQSGTSTTGDGDVVRYAYAGDSVTAMSGSWLRLATADDTRLDAVGGFARSGFRSDEVLDRISAVPDADVLVVELGTNDIREARTTASVITNINAVVRKVGAPRVVLVASPPSNRTTSARGIDRRTGGAALNTELRAAAGRHGWTYVDPYARYREADNGWTSGASADGVHPTSEVNRTVETAVTDAIERTASRR